MTFCDTGCSGVPWNPRNGRMLSSLRRFAEEPESEGVIWGVGRGAWGVGPEGLLRRRTARNDGWNRELLGIPWPRNRELLRIRRVIARWLGRETGHSGGDAMVTAVKWIVLPDGHWMERCVRHVPAAVREYVDGPGELPAFIEVRVVDERMFTCPACWAERMRS